MLGAEERGNIDGRKKKTSRTPLGVGGGASSSSSASYWLTKGEKKKTAAAAKKEGGRVTGRTRRKGGEEDMCQVCQPQCLVECLLCVRLLSACVCVSRLTPLGRQAHSQKRPSFFPQFDFEPLLFSLLASKTMRREEPRRLAIQNRSAARLVSCRFVVTRVADIWM